MPFASLLDDERDTVVAKGWGWGTWQYENLLYILMKFEAYILALAV